MIIPRASRQDRRLGKNHVWPLILKAMNVCVDEPAEEPSGDAVPPPIPPRPAVSDEEDINADVSEWLEDWNTPTREAMSIFESSVEEICETYLESHSMLEHLRDDKFPWPDFIQSPKARLDLFEELRQFYIGPNIDNRRNQNSCTDDLEGFEKLMKLAVREFTEILSSPDRVVSFEELDLYMLILAGKFAYVTAQTSMASARISTVIRINDIVTRKCVFLATPEEELETLKILIGALPKNNYSKVSPTAILNMEEAMKENKNPKIRLAGQIVTKRLRNLVEKGSFQRMSLLEQNLQFVESCHFKFHNPAEFLVLREILRKLPQLTENHFIHHMSFNFEEILQILAYKSRTSHADESLICSSVCHVHAKVIKFMAKKFINIALGTLNANEQLVRAMSDLYEDLDAVKKYRIIDPQPTQLFPKFPVNLSTLHKYIRADLQSIFKQVSGKNPPVDEDEDSPLNLPEEALEPEVVEPKVVVPEVVVTDVDAPEVVPPGVAASEVVAPEVVAPEVAADEVVAPEVVLPEAVAPEVVAPEVVAPEVVSPEVVTPKVIPPEVVTPEVVAPAECAAARAKRAVGASKFEDMILNGGAQGERVLTEAEFENQLNCSGEINDLRIFNLMKLAMAGKIKLTNEGLIRQLAYTICQKMAHMRDLKNLSQKQRIRHFKTILIDLVGSIPSLFRGGMIPTHIELKTYPRPSTMFQFVAGIYESANEFLNNWSQEQQTDYRSIFQLVVSSLLRQEDHCNDLGFKLTQACACWDVIRKTGDVFFQEFNPHHQAMNLLSVCLLNDPKMRFKPEVILEGYNILYSVLDEECEPDIGENILNLMEKEFDRFNLLPLRAGTSL